MLKELSRSTTQRNRPKTPNQISYQKSNKQSINNTINNLITRETSTQNTNHNYIQMNHIDKNNNLINNSSIKNIGGNLNNTPVGKLFKPYKPKYDDKINLNLQNDINKFVKIKSNSISNLNTNYNTNMNSNLTSNLNSKNNTNINSNYNSNKSLIRKEMIKDSSLKTRPKTPSLNSNLNRYQSNIKNVKNKNMKSFFNSIDQSIPVNYDKSYNYELVNNEMQNLEDMINSIKNKGFDKYENEINEKIQKKDKLENSIQILKSKINMYENEKKYIIKDNSKEKLKISNLQNVSKRYKNISEGILNYQKEIPNYKPKIEELKNETIEINTLIQKEKVNIQLLKENIQKLNKMISDKKRESESIRPALNLLKKHIITLKQKIKNIDLEKTDFMINVSEFVEKGKYH